MIDAEGFGIVAVIELNPVIQSAIRGVAWVRYGKYLNFINNEPYDPVKAHNDNEGPT